MSQTSQMSQTSSVDAVVIGGGIIGLSAAERLAHEGFEVTLFERERIAAGASAGNAASFAFSEVMPMASAAIIRKALGWLMDPTGPFSVVPGDLPHTAKWLLRFALAARRPTYERSLRTLAAMMELEQSTLPQVLERSGLGKLVRRSGALYLYRNAAALQADLPGWQVRADHGIEYEVLDGHGLHTFQPGLSNELEVGVSVPNYRIVSDPRDYCLALHGALGTDRVDTRYDDIERLEVVRDGVVIHGHQGPLVRAGHVVVAAGPWSATLAATLGDRVSLIGERGYNTTFPREVFPSLDRPLFFTADGFVMSPLANAVRVGGASEIASLERAANFERSRTMVRKARALVPGLGEGKGVEWMGIRPTTPDTLPVIGYSGASERVIYAFGHGHLGLTLASSTARLVADLARQRKPAMDIEALSPQRFR